MDLKPKAPNDRQRMLLEAAKSRGYILQLAIEAEKIMEWYISAKLTDTKQKRIELILRVMSPSVSLKKIIDIFIELVNAYDKWFEEKHNGILGKLNHEINERRNQFAHWPLSYQPEDIEMYSAGKGFRLIKLKSNKIEGIKMQTDSEIYTSARVNQVLETMTEINIAIGELVEWEMDEQTPPVG